MSVNKYKPHVWIVPEDRANQQLAFGFRNTEAVNAPAVGISPPAGGWKHVFAVFTDEYVPHLRRHKSGHVVLLFDFDEDDHRRQECERGIPDDLKPRVFLIGARSEPEMLRAELNLAFEVIGARAAADCVNATGFWSHPQLAHNAAEVERMTAALKPILFTS